MEGKSDYDCDLKHVSETLRNAKDYGHPACLLIGAGCSVSAGIPTANGFVKRIEEKYTYKYGLAQPKTYPYCMEKLHRDEQRELIAELVDEAKINWVHICIALLLREGYVDRVLTTNFDPLVARACALLNEFPAVFDCAASQLFQPADITGNAIFHLHGQRTGFIMLTTQEQVARQKKQLAPIFEDAGRGRTWIVVGYSGECDPVFELLANVREFTRGLYWVAYEYQDPGRHVTEGLLKNAQGTQLIKGHNADSFFIELTRELKCFPPEVICKPFSHLESCLAMLSEFPNPGENREFDVLATTRSWVKKAKETTEDIEPKKAEATRLLMKGDYGDVIALAEGVEESSREELAGLLAEAYRMRAFADAERVSIGKDVDRDAVRARVLRDLETANILVPEWLSPTTNPSALSSRLQILAKLKSDPEETLVLWARMLIQKAKTRSYEHDRAIDLIDLAEARRKLEDAELHAPGVGAYDLARISALQSREEECRSWLAKSRTAGKLPGAAHLREDGDLGVYRDRQWFKDLLAELEAEEASD